MSIIIIAFSLCGCAHPKTNSIMEEYGRNVLIVDPDNISNGAFHDLSEVTNYYPIKSNKRFKFIILSGTSSTDISDIKNKIIEGYTVIYPQTDREILDNFLKSFSVRLENNSYKVNGCILKRDLNTTTQTYYIQATPSYSNATQTSKDYIRSEIESTVSLDLPYKDNPEFLGVYISKVIYSDGNFKELKPFSVNATYDKFDAFDKKTNKNFVFSYNEKKQAITYSVDYEINKEKMEFFYTYMIVQDFYGNINAIPLKNSAFTHSGIAHTLTEEIPICSGAKAFADVPEILKINFKFI